MSGADSCQRQRLAPHCANGIDRHQEASGLALYLDRARGTALYCGLVFILFGKTIASLLEPSVSLSDLGDALSGLFAPLAPIWIIVGILQQGKELQVQVRDLKESVEAQKAMAKASGGQERLQNEQFLERLYRLYRAAGEDVLYQLLEFDHLQYMVTDGGGGMRSVGMLERDFLDPQRAAFQSGNRSAVLSIVKRLARQLSDADINASHAKFVVERHLLRVRALAEDFVKFDDLRREALSRFEGGEALGRVDSRGVR